MPDSIQHLDAHILKKAAGLQRCAPQPRSPQPRLPRCLRRAGHAFGLCGDARLAARRATTSGKRRLCRTAARWSASTAATPVVSFCGGCGSAAAPTTRGFISAPTRRCAAWTPPAPPPGSTSAGKATCWRTSTPTTTTPTAGRGPGARTAPTSPPTSLRKGLPHQRVWRAAVPGQSPSTTSPTAWRPGPALRRRPQRQPSLSRAWPAALAGA